MKIVVAGMVYKISPLLLTKHLLETYVPLSLFPQHTTLPSDFNAANAYSVAKIMLTDVNTDPDGEREEVLPPLDESPNTDTVPSSCNAAKAL